MRATKKEIRTKTSFYMSDSLRKEIAKFVPARKQGEFLHNAAMTMLEQLKEDKARMEFIKKLNEIKPVKRKMTARQTLEKLRKQREKQILKNLKN